MHERTTHGLVNAGFIGMQRFVTRFNFCVNNKTLHPPCV